MGAESTPQVEALLHLSTYKKVSLKIALLPPIVTVKLLATFGVVVLAPAVQVMVVAAETTFVQLIPSIMMTAVPELRLVPVRVIVYPPAMSPYLGLIDVTIGVFTCLYSTKLVKL